MGLYHRNIDYLNEWDSQSLEIVKSAKRLSSHMWHHLDHTDKKHNIDLQKLFLIVKNLQKYTNVEPFEVEVEKGDVVKCVIRTEYDDEYDISIVFRKDVIITAYLNKKDDLHSTLKSEKYDK